MQQSSSCATQGHTNSCLKLFFPTTTRKQLQLINRMMQKRVAKGINCHMGSTFARLSSEASSTRRPLASHDARVLRKTASRVSAKLTPFPKMRQKTPHPHHQRLSSSSANHDHRLTHTLFLLILTLTVFQPLFRFCLLVKSFISSKRRTGKISRRRKGGKTSVNSNQSHERKGKGSKNTSVCYRN